MIPLLEQSVFAAPGTIKCQKLRAPEQAGPFKINITLQNNAEKIPSLFNFSDNPSFTKSYHYETNAWRGDLYITLIQTDKPVYKPGQTGMWREI